MAHIGKVCHIEHGFWHNKITKDFEWDNIEVITDSPLAAKFTECYRQLRPYCDKEAKQVLKDKYETLFSGVEVVIP